MSRNAKSSEARTYYNEYFHLRPREKPQRMVACPFHTDGKASLSINLDTGLWKCHAGCGSGTLTDFKQRLNGGTQPVNGKSSSTPRQKWTFGSLKTVSRTPVAAYEYQNAKGIAVMRKLRFEPKNFMLQRRDGDAWVDGLTNDTERPLYNLTRVLQAKCLVWCEGEKDVDRVQSVLDQYQGLEDWAATTTYETSSGWKPQYDAAIKGKKLVITVPDNDEHGRQYMAVIARGCYLAGVGRIATLALPGLADGGDVSDFLDTDSDDNLVALLHDKPSLEPYKDPVGELIRTLGQIRRETPDKVPWLVDGLLARGAMTLVMGQPKIGKSTVVHNMLLDMLRGRQFISRATQEVSNIVYLTDMPATDVMAELGAIPAFKEHEDKVHIFLFQDALRFSWSDAIVGATALAMRKKAPLLIIDTFASWARVQNENDASEVIAALAPIYDALNKDLCVLLQNHERKTGGDILTAGRGSNSLAGAASIIVSVRKPDGNHKSDNSLRTLEIIGRHGAATWVINLTPDGYRLEGTVAAVATERAQSQIFDRLPDTKDKAISRKQIMDKLKADGIKISLSTFQRAAEGLEKSNFICSKEGARHTRFYWRVLGGKEPKAPRY